MSKVNEICGKTPVIIGNKESYMQVDINDFNWLLKQADIATKLQENNPGLVSKELQENRRIKENLFCVEVVLDNGKFIFHHTVATDSQQAFNNTSIYLDSKNLVCEKMSCTIINYIDGYKVNICKEE